MKNFFDEYIRNEDDFEIDFYFSNGQKQSYISQYGDIDFEAIKGFALYNQNSDKFMINLSNVDYIKFYPASANNYDL